MVIVELTPHLYRFFPQLESRAIRVPSGSVAEILEAINQLAPGFTDYVLDEHGGLRRHVKLSIDSSILVDRKTLSDQVRDGSTVYIFQALSGG